MGEAAEDEEGREASAGAAPAVVRRRARRRRDGTGAGARREARRVAGPGDCLKLLVLVGWQGPTTARYGAGAFQSLREGLGGHKETLVPWALVANREIVGFGLSRAFSSVKPMADGEALVDSPHFQRAEGPGTAARIAALRRALGCGEALRGSEGGRLRGAGAGSSAGSSAGILPAVPGPAGYRRRHRAPAALLRIKAPPELPGTSSRRIERCRSAATASSTSAKIPVG